jgi:hypothetical protein
MLAGVDISKPVMPALGYPSDSEGENHSEWPLAL